MYSALRKLHVVRASGLSALAIGIASSATSTRAAQEESSSPRPPQRPPPVEHDIMDKIARKPYLQHRPSKGGEQQANMRPTGVPSKLRVLTVDLPSFRSTLTAPCRLDTSVNYPDGTVSKYSSKRGEKKPQTSWARGLVCCGQAEVLECSVALIKDRLEDVAYEEEMQIRLSGRVPKFSSSMERGGWLSRALFGSEYKWHGSRAMEREGDNAAPHAVVADGGELEKVPGSLMMLSAACKSAGVPLFVVNDPRRSWGGKEVTGEVQTPEEELYDTAKELRTKIKGAVVQRALRIKEGDAYKKGKERGRKQGEAKWRVRESDHTQHSRRHF